MIMSLALQFTDTVFPTLREMASKSTRKGGHLYPLDFTVNLTETKCPLALFATKTA